MNTIPKTLLTRCILAAFALTAIAPVATAQTFPDWVSPCGTAIGGADMGEKTRLIRATAALLPPSQLVPSDVPGYYRLSAQTGGFTSIFGYPLVPGVQFYGEPQMSPNGRAGYLVAPDIIVTASHGQFDQNAYAIVFDMRPQIPVGGTSCQPPDFDHIPAANIIFPPHGPVLADFPDSIPSTITDSRFDYAAFRLTTPRTDRSFLRLRRDGDPQLGDHHAMAGHPERLAQKLSKDVGFVGMMTDALGSRPPTVVPRYRNYALLDGSSGSPLYNLTKGFVETSVGSPVGFGCMQFDASTSMPGYYSFSNVCPADAAFPGTYTSLLNMGSIKTFAAEVPAAELLVTPLQDVIQVIPFGGTLASTSFPYELRVDGRTTASVDYSASVVPPAPGNPTLLSMSSSSGTLLPGTSATKTVTVSSAAIARCGVYEQSVSFADTTHNFGDRIKHRLEVGLTDFQIEAPASNRFQGVASPYLPPQVQYTLRNPRPTAVRVEVSTTAAWLRIDGQSVPPSGTLLVGYDLSAQGTPGDSVVITMALDNAQANALPIAENSANLVFSDTSRCHNPDSDSQRTEAIVLDKRDLTVGAEILALVPEAATLDPTVSTVNVSQAFCVGDIEVSAGFVRDPTLNGNGIFQFWKPDLDLYLINPAGLRAQIWDGAAEPSNWPYEPGVYGGYSITSLRVNRGALLPPSGSNLDTFLNHPAAGTWTLQIADQVVNSVRGMATHWQLKLKGTPGACPP
ncbi:hypothetical protein DFR29_103230 [Tahibacter aquaticus]|uniref:P/Homo B domain-containing protein n=2 Tax=Tahibacter aquaticus TaxID=520092 RepID=A0A4R6Z4Y5_9GAMM|nr:hypothetical protein DFR29_103230 [Tahibacter aquaticus]